MNDLKSNVEKIYRIHDEKENVYLEIGPDRDSFTWPEIRTIGDKSSAYFGDIRLILNPDMAKKLAYALLDCANDLSD